MKNGCNFEVPEPGFQYTLKMFEPLGVPLSAISQSVSFYLYVPQRTLKRAQLVKRLFYYSRRGLAASKMEAALFVLQTCSERIPWGGLSCVNLFHNDRNAAEPKP